jgi:hypothetical protein
MLRFFSVVYDACRIRASSKVSFLPLAIVLASCDQPSMEQSVRAADFAGPPSGGVVVLRSTGGNQAVRQRKLEGRGLNSSGHLVVADSAIGDPNAKFAMVELAYSVRTDGIAVSAAAGPEVLILPNAESVPSNEWTVGSMSAGAGELAKTFPLSGKCRIEAKARRLIAEQERFVITTRCIAILADGGQLVQFRDFAEGLGLVGMTNEVHAVTGAMTDVSGWRFERLDLVMSP